MSVLGPRSLRSLLQASALLASTALASMAILPQAIAAEAAGSAEILPGMEQATPSQLAAKTLLLAVARVPGSVIAVGQWGHVVISKDDGKTWTQATTVPTRPWRHDHPYCRWRGNLDPAIIPPRSGRALAGDPLYLKHPWLCRRCLWHVFRDQGWREHMGTAHHFR